MFNAIQSDFDVKKAFKDEADEDKNFKKCTRKNYITEMLKK